MSVVTPAAPETSAPPAAAPGRFVAIGRRVMRKPLGAASVVYLVLLVAACAAASLIAPYGPLAQDLTAVDQGPSAAHLFGTDSLGRDLLSRLLFGGQATLLGVAEAVIVTTVLGVSMGVLSGYVGGWLDRVLARVADVLMSLPSIIILLAVLVLFDQSMLAAMVTFGVLGSTAMFRVVRGVALGLREELYVAAARVCGLSHRRIITRHVLSRAQGPIIVQISLFASVALVVQTGLSYLGLGIQPPAPSWGGMIADAQQVLIGDPWQLVPPGVIVALTVLAFGLLGDSVRDALQEHRAGRGISKAVFREVPSTSSAEDRSTQPSDPDTVLAIRDLTITTTSGPEPRNIVTSMDLDLRQGEILGIVGETGCGKSVTMLAALGLLPSGLAVTSGRVWLSGQEIALGDARHLAGLRGSQIGMVFQEPIPSLDPAFRVGSQLAEVVRAHTSLSRRAARDRVLELLRQVSLTDPAAVAARYPHQLSGGMAQRVAIAIALAGGPRVLIADEPTTALDVSVQAEILDLLRELNSAAGMSIVLVTHDWGVVADICDRAAVLYAGEIVELAPVADLWNRPRHPYTADLMAANPYFAPPGQALRTIPGRVPEPGQRPSGCRYEPRCAVSSPDCAESAVPLTLAGPGAGAFRCRHSERIPHQARSTT